MRCVRACVREAEREREGGGEREIPGFACVMRVSQCVALYTILRTSDSERKIQKRSNFAKWCPYVLFLITCVLERTNNKCTPRRQVNPPHRLFRLREANPTPTPHRNHPHPISTPTTTPTPTSAIPSPPHPARDSDMTYAYIGFYGPCTQRVWGDVLANSIHANRSAHGRLG